MPHTITIDSCPKCGGAWKFYDGALGYESFICSNCRFDIAEIKLVPNLQPAKETPRTLVKLNEQTSATFKGGMLTLGQSKLTVSDVVYIHMGDKTAAALRDYLIALNLNR